MLAAPPPPSHPEPGYAEVRRLDLQAAFHTRRPWAAYVLAPTGPDAAAGERPIQVCFTDGRDRPDCTAVRGSDQTGGAYPCQTLGGVEAIGRQDPAALRIEALSPTRKAVTVTATFSGGGPGALTQYRVFTYLPSDDSFLSAGVIQAETGLGEMKGFAAGPWAGFYLTAEAAWAEGETRWDPHRFTIDAYRLTKDGGYLRVLSYVTGSKYPAERETADYVIDHELPRLGTLLKAAYPQGAPPF